MPMTLDMRTCILLSMAEHTYVVLHHATDPMLADLEVRFVSCPFVFYFCKQFSLLYQVLVSL